MDIYSDYGTKIVTLASFVEKLIFIWLIGS